MIHRILPILLLSAVMLGVVAMPAAAQAELGIKGGVNFSKFAIEPEDDDATFPYIYGPTGGIYLTLGNGPVAIQIEGLYSRKGTKVEQPSQNLLFKLDDIDIPILLRFNGASSNGTTFFATVGPTLNYNFRSMVEDSDGFDDDIKDDIRDLTYGISFGLGVEVDSILVEGRYTHGLSDLLEEGVDDIMVKHRTFTVMLGFGF